MELNCLTGYSMSSCNSQINMIIGDVNFEVGVCYSIFEEKTPSLQHSNVQLLVSDRNKEQDIVK